MDAFTRDGRYQPAAMAAIAVTWSAFGADTRGWQWVRFLVMTGVIITSIMLARRLGASAIAAVAAGLLFVVAGMAQQSWLLLQVAEPRGTLVLMGSALLAVNYGESERWPLRALAIVGLLVIAILYKETFIVAAPVVLALALWARNDGRWVIRQPTMRDFVLVFGALLAIGLANVVPLLQIRELADSQAYAARYDIGAVSAAKLRNVISAFFLPVTRVWWFPANVVFVASIVAGVALGVRRYGRSALMSAGVLFTLLLVGALLYSPWFAVEGYYAFAFLPGLVGLFALGLTWLWQSRARAARFLAGVSIGLVGVYGLLISLNYVNAYRASRVVEEQTARALNGLEGRSLVVAVPSPGTSGGFASGLRGYALALGVAGLPEGQDLGCEEAAALVTQRAPAIVVVFSTFCGSQTIHGVAPMREIRRFYIAREWKTFLPAHEEIRARIWAPNSRPASAVGGARGTQRSAAGRPRSS
jgi:hypothetical protein